MVCYFVPVFGNFSCMFYFIVGRAGVPMEVMGLMLGEFVDEYTVNVVDVFAMPQSGTCTNIYKFCDKFFILF